MRAAARAMKDSVIAQGRGGTHQAREERDAIVRTALARLEQLQIGDEALCFGRIDRSSGETFHIGRLGISDENQEPLIVDWRAPVAEPFYRATGRHPMGVVRRRHFITHGHEIVGIEDEVLDLDAVGDDRRLSGEGALLAALERSRTGAMRDIVATIQGEQDEIIRAPMAGALVVQGAPGTGKTAVALHRAAYLLYTHRFPLERQGVLVVGPNPVFLRYIEQVLPSLGETGADLSTISGLYGRVRPRAADTPAAARVKGDARMAKVLSRAVSDRQRPLVAEVVIPYRAFTLRLTPEVSARVVTAGRRRRGKHNARRAFVENEALRALHDQYEQSAARARRAGLRDLAPEAETDFDDFAEEVRSRPEFRAALDRMWPRLTPEELLHDLLAAPALLRLAARGVLDPSEQHALRRKRYAAEDDVPWTDADIALLDEAAVILGPRRKRRNDQPFPRTFGHIVVDEAQDLTPMQLRMIGRRSLSGSVTLVGDIGQATGAFTPSSWDDVLAHLPGGRRPPRVVELTVNYRTPVEVMDLAARVLARAAPALRPPRSVRSVGEFPRFRQSEPGHVATESARAATALRDRVGGTVAIVCPPSMVAAVEDAVGRHGEIDLDEPVSVVPVEMVKGLEFDAVVVVEPAQVVAESPQGLRALYVALTRTTKQLHVVYSGALPDVLLSGDRPAATGS